MASATLIGQTSNTELTVGLIDATGTVTYQWKSSTDGASFSDIAGATNAAFNYSSYYSTVNTTTYIRPVVTANGIEYSDIAVIKVYKVANNTKIDMTFGSDINPSIGQAAFASCTSLASLVIGNSVTSIGNYAFYNCDSLATLVIGDSVTSIDNNAFYGCTSLATIDFGSVTSIGQDAFAYCTSLANIDFGSVTSIGQAAFASCTSLATIDFGSVTSIGDYAFASCTSLATLTIGDSVTSIGLDAFYGCNSLATITVSSDNTTFFTDDKSILYQITDTTNNNVTAVLCPPATTITDITIDTVLKNETSYTVTSISYSVYQDCTSLETVTIGDSVTSIGQGAFQNCDSLATIDFGSVTSIGQAAFASCTSLATIDFGSVTSIGQDAFAYCTSLATLTIGDSVTSIGQGAFQNCDSLATIDFGSVTSIGNNAFQSCDSLATLTIGDSVTSIGTQAFSGCAKLETITVSSDNTTFFTDDKSILYQITTGTTNVTAVLCPPATTITDITIDTVLKNETTTPTYTVTSIEQYAFASCTSLAILTIGDSVTSIGQGAFQNCDSLATIDFGSVTSIGDYAFFGCTTLATIDFGSVTEIGQGAFQNCDSLATIDFGSVTSIGTQAFQNCRSLATLTIGDSVTSIGQHAFSGCTSLANIYFLGTKPSSIGNGNFISKSGDTAYYRDGQTGWINATINGISKIRRIPTIDPIITTTTITGSCDANLSPVLVYISMNNGLTWFKYTATKDSPTSTTWTLNHKFANRQSFKVSTIANYYNLDINDAQNIYCNSYTNNGNYSLNADTSLSTFTIGGAAAYEEDFAVTFPKGTPSVDVTAIPTKIENPRAGVSITVNDATPIVYKNGADFVNTKSISLNPGENEVTITVTILPSSTEDYTGYIHVLPDAPVITTTFTTGYTNDNTPTLSGTTDAALDTNGENTTVTLYTVTTETITDEDGENTTIETYTSLGEATFTATGQSKATWTFTPTDAFADGTHTIVATAQYSTSVQDEDLNVESDYSTAITFTVDTVAPNKPVIVSTIKTDVISGTAEANSTVLVKKDGDQVATAAVNSAGVWTLKVASIDSYAPAKYSYVGQDTALNVSDATTFDTSQFTIRYPPITFQTDKSKTVMPFITGRLSGDTSTVFTVANQYKLTQIGAKASIDRNTGRLTVKMPNATKGTYKIAVKASSPIYGTKVATVTIVVK